MRRYLVIFMLFLLPLRGLVGDAMAYSMLPAGLVSGQNVAQTVGQVAIENGAAYASILDVSGTIGAENAAPAGSTLPCHMDMAAADGADTSANQCTTCQVCHLSASTPTQLPSGMLHTCAAVPAQHAAHWASAEPRLLAKTPVL